MYQFISNLLNTSWNCISPFISSPLCLSLTYLLTPLIAVVCSLAQCLPCSIVIHKNLYMCTWMHNNYTNRDKDLSVKSQREKSAQHFQGTGTFFSVLLFWIKALSVVWSTTTTYCSQLPQNSKVLFFSPDFGLEKCGLGSIVIWLILFSKLFFTHFRCRYIGKYPSTSFLGNDEPAHCTCSASYHIYNLVTFDFHQKYFEQFLQQWS